MTTHNARSSSGGRRSGRGPRRRSGGNRDEYRPAGADRQQQQRTPEKPGLIQKILSIFGLGKKSAPAARSNGAPRQDRSERQERSTATVTSNYPDRPPQSSPRPSRKPEAVEVTSPKLYVGNLSFDATESDLTELFSGVGQVQNADIVSHKDTERSKGFGFVTMVSVEEARRAVEVLHDKDFMGRKLVVSGAKTPIER
jgi:RNA recognition motif-containing protein